MVRKTMKEEIEEWKRDNGNRNFTVKELVILQNVKFDGINVKIDRIYDKLDKGADKIANNRVEIARTQESISNIKKVITFVATCFLGLLGAVLKWGK